MNEPMILTINILLYATAFILGFIVGKMSGNAGIGDPRIDPKGSFFNQQIRQRKNVEIDEKKFVTAISTDSLEKKGKELGTKTVVNDDVGSSVSKLAMLKKNK